MSNWGNGFLLDELNEYDHTDYGVRCVACYLPFHLVPTLVPHDRTLEASHHTPTLYEANK
jgi:hypothetical protein